MTTAPVAPPARPSSRSRAVTVPPVTPGFWAAKVATTAFGEAFSDFVFFNDYVGQHPAILMGLGLLIVCLVAQFAVQRYVPVVYWSAVTAVSIFGTMSADFLNKDLGLPLWASTAALLVLQGSVFTAWWRSQRSLDVHGIDRPSREAFYWLTVLFTFALGTAAGDFAATALGLGTAASAGVFLLLIAATAAAHRWLRLGGVPAFWIVYTFTRPLGASIADWLGVPAPYGDGLQLGTGPMSIVCGAVLVAVVAVLAVRRHQGTATR